MLPPKVGALLSLYIRSVEKRPLFNSFQKVAASLIGEPGKTTLESRIFNATCLIVIFVTLYNIPFNYYIGLREASFISALLFFIFSGLYYLCRVKDKFYASITMAGILASLLLGINYFFNAGVVGSSLLLFLLVFFLVSIIAPTRQAVFWFCLNLVIVLALLTIEYHYPQSIVSGYSSRLNYLIDVASTYVVGITLIGLATQFIRNAYRAEQRSVEEKSVVLEQLNAEKNKLFSIVSHDLRAPLASVQQYLEIIREVDLDEEQRTQIKSELLDIVSHTQEMLSNLLSWSTSQMSGLKVNRVPVTIHSVLKPIVEIYKPLAAKKSLHLELLSDPALMIWADTNMAQLIVRNLLGNAIKFTPSGGFISISTELAGADCVISIKDSGLGIKAEDKEAIFSLKSRATFGTNNERGVGLGLFLCKEYAEVQQGRLWFESEPGVGTTFYLALPRVVETV